MNYSDFLKEFDKKLEKYFDNHSEYICCKAGCSSCCETGDYPLTELELEYLMQGFIHLENKNKSIVQNNIKNMVKGGCCPFLYEKKCLVYAFRPIICRVHGIAYICRDKTVKVPYCTKLDKNYSKVYQEGYITINPVIENLDTLEVLKNFNHGEMRNLYDWIKFVE